MKLSDTETKYLVGQLNLGRVILFTGAGFSMGTRDVRGRPLPSGWTFAKELWDEFFAHEELDDNLSLPDVFQWAARTQQGRLREFMMSRFAIDPATVADWHRVWFSVPWRRIYTLNIDNLAEACAVRHTLPATFSSVSALAGEIIGGVKAPAAIDVVHLNGRAEDGPLGVTFSTTQFADRLGRPDAWYLRLATELASHPFVFVGTPLEEPVLWQYVQLRGQRGGRDARELRPKSFLVSPELSKARQALLRDYNVFWIKATAEEFATDVLSRLATASRAGFSVLRGSAGTPLRERLNAEKQAADEKPDQGTAFLLGHEPVWSDIRSSRAVVREIDIQLASHARALLAAAPSNALDNQKPEPRRWAPLLVVTGTAGAGKSTSLRRLVLTLVADGRTVAFVAPHEDVSPRALAEYGSSDAAPDVLAIDDADRYGSSAAPLLRELISSGTIKLVAVATRASKVEKTVERAKLPNVEIREEAIPHLQDADIDALIAALERENKLGALKGLSPNKRIEVFKQKAGRQLLVAMLEATSGKLFEEKVCEEWEELDSNGQHVYGLIALATSLRHPLSRADVLLGVGASGAGTEGNDALNALELLARRHIVRDIDGKIWARHRVIANLLIQKLHQRGQLALLHQELAYIAATLVTPQLPRDDRRWRFVKAALNHSYLFRMVDLAGARQVYEQVEQLLNWDYHYWLQRGSLEIEDGSLYSAELALDTAHSIASDDPYVLTARAYLLLKKAAANPAATAAQSLASEGIAILQGQISTRGRKDPYPYHVLGSQGLGWVRRAQLSMDEKRKLLKLLLRALEDARANHPREAAIEQLWNDLKREELSLAVPSC